MNILSTIWRELIGLFIDDKFLASGIVGVVIVAGGLSFGPHASSDLVGAVLLIGCVTVLVVSAYRGTKGSN